MKRKVIVIGAGPAGMMAAITAAESGAEVLLLEKNPSPGRKLLITGNGRCNLTNNTDPDGILKNVVRNPRFLMRAVRAFSPEDVMKFFADAGLALVEEDNGRIFPASGRAADVLRVLTTKLDERGVQVRTGADVSSLLIEQSRPDSKPVVKGVRVSPGEEIEADITIIACGGKAVPSTGSAGDGAMLAAQAGHTVEPLTPALVPFNLAENNQTEGGFAGDGFAVDGITAGGYAADRFAERGFAESGFAELQGLVLKGVRLKYKKTKVAGDLLFTHFGISGPAAIELSSRLTETPDVITADVVTDVPEERIDKLLVDIFQKGGIRQIVRILTESGELGLPERFIRFAVRAAGIPDDRRGCDITKAERRQLAAVLKGLSLTVSGTAGFEQAMVTRGGVNTKEIDPVTMGSKLADGLRFAGEVIDVDALTGGFNLQIAWSTGRAAGEHI